MKLVINIPCYNEEKTLPLVLKEIPKKIDGIDKIEIQIVDDGSTDNTVKVAKELGVDRIIIHKKNKGLGWAFKSGTYAALDAGCDIFVNTDADNQYPSKYIEKLVKPILDKKADIVVGNRSPWKVEYFSPLKRYLQYIGNWSVRKMLGINVPDTVSGFRAYSRNALLKINVITQFSYVLDTLMQASKKGLKVVNIDIKTNPPTRKSRLFKNIFQHIRKSAANIIRMFYLYEPFKTFLIIGSIFLIPGLYLFFRFFYYYSIGSGGHMQSLIISSILLITSVLLFGFGIVADSIKVNRMLQEDLLYFYKKDHFKRK